MRMAREKREEYTLRNEITRKTVHLAGSLFILALYQFTEQRIALIVLTIGLIVALELEYFRIEWGHKIPLFHNLFRQKEKKTLGGHVFLAISSIIAISVFSKEIATLAILMTAVGDAAAAIFGRIYGKYTIPGFGDKKIEGVFAEFAADILAGFAYLSVFGGHIGAAYMIILVVMAASATIIETMANKLDDNLLVPVFAGIIGEMLVSMLPIIGITT